ncbi:MAG: hypothetical protein Q4F02_01050 [Candidatus Saccharibacteria bacterium]|nr:hypothetical protein [Candidatus Saccharibacteria bacterium]
MARNEKFTAPAPSVEKGEDSGRPGPLKKLVLAGIAVGTAFNTAACSAEDWESPRPTATVTVTETATPSAAPEAATSEVGKEQSDIEIKPTPEEMQRAKEIVLPEIEERLNEFEGLIASGELSQYNVLSGKDSLSFYGDEHHIPGYGEEQGVTFEGRNSLGFFVTPTLEGTTLRVSQEASVSAYQNGELVKYDEMSSELKKEEAKLEESVTVKFSIPEGYLSDGDLAPDTIRKVLKDPETLMTDISSDIRGLNKHAWDDGGILNSYEYKYEYDDAGDGTMIFLDGYGPRETLERILSDYLRGAGK